ncbi:MAG: nucleotide exchange factor GrpE [Collinsella sp.]
MAEAREQPAAAEDAREAAEAKAAERREPSRPPAGRLGELPSPHRPERLDERARATEKLIEALLPVVDDMERALDHARTQELADDFKQFVDGVDAVRSKLLSVFDGEGVEAIDPKGEAFDCNIHQAVGRVEDVSQYDETVNDVYQKGYRMGGKVLRPAMVTVTYGGETRPVIVEDDEDAEAETE